MSICLVYSCLFIVISLSFFVSRLIFLINNYIIIIEIEIFSLNYNSLVIIFLFDWISLLFISFVLFISSIVIYYRNEYIYGDLNLNRFILLIVIFVFSIIIIIIRPNIVRILIGWDGLGLVSYCLVIYYQNVKSNNAGILTALTNRIGDVILLISICWIINYGRWNFIFYLEFIKNDLIINIVGILVLLAAITKRAQIPFSSWLPAAIAAPTPVSSLVHSSTLVTAGVYLLIRFGPSLNQGLILFLLFIGTITIFIAGLGANFEYDLKKIIALSTLSQLGLIIRILALGEYNLAFYHLLTHALFKATLFICAGNIIHRIINCQDIRFIGNMIIHIPLTCVIFNISNLSLCGFPFLAGFYSKDLILELLSINYLRIYIYVFFFISTGLTVSYTFRLIYYTMIGNFNFYRLNSIVEINYVILKRIFLLVFIVCVGGRILIWLILTTPYFICLPFIIKIIAVLVRVLGGILGYEISKFSLNYKIKSLNFNLLTYFFSSMWNMPILSTYRINFIPLLLRFKYYKNLDQGWFEYMGRQNLYCIFKNKSQLIQIIFNNNLKIYLLIIVFWLIFLLIILLYYLNSLKRV